MSDPRQSFWIRPHSNPIARLLVAMFWTGTLGIAVGLLVSAALIVLDVEYFHFVM